MRGFLRLTAAVVIAIAAGVLTVVLTKSSTLTAGTPDPTCNASRPLSLGDVGWYAHEDNPMTLTVGQMLVVAGWHQRGSNLDVELRAFDASCRPEASFGHAGTATLVYAHAGPTTFVDSVVRLANGQILILAGNRSDWLLGEVGARGEIDQAFGDHGWEQLRVPVPPEPGEPAGPLATDAVLSPSGSIFVGGTDGRAHCCVGDYVAAISSSGAIRPTFGDRGWVHLSGFTGSFTTDVYAVGRDSVLAVGLVEFMDCGGSQFVQLNARGVENRAFAAAIKRSLAWVVPPPRFLHAAVLTRPGGRFDLVGEVFPGCVAPEFSVPLRHAYSSVEGIDSDGAIDRSVGTGGVTTVGFDNSDTVSVLPLDSGGFAMITEPEPISDESSAPSIIRIREFTSVGRLDTAFGKRGVLDFNLDRLVGKSLYPTATVLVGPDSTFVVVASGDHGTELTRIIG